MNETAFQDRMQRNHCWGCGASNPDGLQIKSYWDGDESVCTWQPKDYHSAGPPGVLNGGIIASTIDCHSICTAIADAHHAEGRDIGTEPVIWYATGSLQVSYKRPSPITGPVSLRARITERTERKTVLSCSVVVGGEECAVGEVVAVRVPAEWLDA